MRSTNQQAEKQSPYRLPNTVVPSFCEYTIEPDIKGGKHFRGSGKIQIKVLQPVREIILNAADMEISDVALTEDSGTTMLGTATVDNTSERATIRFDGVVGAGHWELEFKFVGTFNQKLKGFYLSRYKGADGSQEVMATTKFEPCDARRAFPCWDEPAFKTRFKISLIIDEDLQAVSNSRLLNETALDNGKKMLEFAPSIKMSSYLVAYVIGKLEASEPVYADKVPIRIWTVPGKSHLGKFASQAAKFSLEYFARYFQHAYPSDKLDLVAIPDFASGAMENFACITFRETALLVDENTASHAELERVAEVVMHENAHMWFGDYATMSWWNGLWLNEAFATFMEVKALHAWKPEWKLWEAFNVQRAVAMRVDGLHETRPIEFAVRNPDDARGMFDVLTYQKGCAILRMLELFIGEEDFRRGIIAYLDKHAFDNADTPDLWSAIEQHSAPLAGDSSVGKMMDTWVYQAGYPVIGVEESQVTGSVRLSQKAFKYLRHNAPEHSWQVPIHLRAQIRHPDGKTETVEKTVLLSGESQTFYIGENIQSIIVNAGGHGFYRVDYADNLRKKLVDNLNLLSASERFNFVNDLWASVLAGDTSVASYLASIGIVTAVHRELDLNVFSIIVGSLQTLRRIVPPSSTNQNGLLNAVRTIAEPALNQLGLTAKPEETVQNAQLRALLMSALGTFGDPEILKWAEANYANYSKDHSSVDTNLIGAMVDTLAYHGDAALYDQFVALKEAAKTPQEETRFLFALPAFRDSALAARTLNACIDGTVRTQDAPMVMRNVLTNTTTARQAFEFIRDNWEKINSLYPAQGVTRLCDGIPTCTGDDLSQPVRDFFARQTVRGGEKALKQNLEQLSINVALRDKERAGLEDLLRTAYKQGS